MQCNARVGAEDAEETVLAIDASLCDHRRQLLPQLEFLSDDHHTAEILPGCFPLRHRKGMPHSRSSPPSRLIGPAGPLGYPKFISGHRFGDFEKAVAKLGAFSWHHSSPLLTVFTCLQPFD